MIPENFALPEFARNFLVDFIETGLGLVFALNLIVPGDLDQAKAQGLIIGSAVAAGGVSAARRALPGFYAWVRDQLNVAA